MSCVNFCQFHVLWQHYGIFNTNTQLKRKKFLWQLSRFIFSWNHRKINRKSEINEFLWLDAELHNDQTILWVKCSVLSPNDVPILVTMDCFFFATKNRGSSLQNFSHFFFLFVYAKLSFSLILNDSILCVLLLWWILMMMHLRTNAMLRPIDLQFKDAK